MCHLRRESSCWFFILFLRSWAVGGQHLRAGRGGRVLAPHPHHTSGQDGGRRMLAPHPHRRAGSGGPRRWASGQCSPVPTCFLEPGPSEPERTPVFRTCPPLGGAGEDHESEGQPRPRGWASGLSSCPQHIPSCLIEEPGPPAKETLLNGPWRSSFTAEARVSGAGSGPSEALSCSRGARTQ